MITALLFCLACAAIFLAIMALSGKITEPFGAIVKYDPAAGRAYDPRAGMAVTYLGEIAADPPRRRFHYEYAGQSRDFESGPSRFADLYDLTALLDSEQKRMQDGPHRAIEIDPSFLDFTTLPARRHRFLHKLFVRLVKEVLPPAGKWKSVSVDLLMPDGRPLTYPSHAVRRLHRRPVPKAERPAYKRVPGQIVLSTSEVRTLRRVLKGPLPPIELDAEARRAWDPATGIAIRYSHSGYIQENEDFYIFEFGGRTAQFNAGIGYDDKVRMAVDSMELSRRSDARDFRKDRLFRISTAFLAVRLLPHDLVQPLLRRIADVFRVCAGQYGATIWVSLSGDFDNALRLNEEVPDFDMDDLTAFLDRKAVEREARTA